MNTPAMPPAIASIKPTKLPVRRVTGVATIAMSVRNALRITSQTMIPSTPRR